MSPRRRVFVAVVATVLTGASLAGAVAAALPDDPRKPAPTRRVAHPRLIDLHRSIGPLVPYAPPKASTRPAISLFAANPPVLAGPGGVVELLAVVEHATRCDIAAVGLGPELSRRCAAASGASTTAISVPAAESPRTLQFVLEISGGGHAVSQTVTIRQLSDDQRRKATPPHVVLQPAPARAVEGTAVRFTAVATGTPTPTEAWEISIGDHKWSHLRSAHSTALRVVADRADDGASFRAVFSNSAGWTASHEARLTVVKRRGPAPTTTTVARPTTTVGPSTTVTEAPPAPSPPSPSPPVTTQPATTTTQAATTTTQAGPTTTQASGTSTSTTTTQPSATSTTAASGSSTSTTAASTTSTSSSTTTTSVASTSSTSTSSTSTSSTSTSSTSTSSTSTSTLPAGAPVITEQPTWYSTINGAEATFSAAASGNPTPTVQWQVSTNSGGSWSNAGGTSTTDTYSFQATSSENGYEFRAQFTGNSDTVDTAAATLTVTEASGNWAGQVDTDSEKYTAVAGSWTVPSVSCTAATTYSSAWIGIDGDPSDTVEQDGTESDCLDDSPSYDAWFELYGDHAVYDGDEVELNPSLYPVSPGDSINASVTYSSGTWTLSIADPTENWTFSVEYSWSTPSRVSAEWIAEAPQVCSPGCDQAQLSDFGSVSFTGATVAAGGSMVAASSFDPLTLDMANGSTVLAGSEPLDETGEQFSIDWYAAS